MTATMHAEVFRATAKTQSSSRLSRLGAAAAQGFKRHGTFFCVLATAALSLVLAPETSRGVSSATVEIGDIQGSGWSAQGLRIGLAMAGTGEVFARLTARRVSLSEPIGVLEQLTVTCRNAETIIPELRCRDAQVSGRLGALGQQNLRADVAYNPRDGSLRFALRQLQLARGTMAVEGRWLTAGWQLQVDARELQLKDLLAFAAPWFALPGNVTLEGTGSFQLSLQGRQSQGRQSLDRIQAQVKLTTLTANNEDGTVATDKLSCDIEADLQPAKRGWHLAASLHSSAGQAYFDPIFVDLATHPTRARLQGFFDSSARSLTLAQLDFEQKDIARMRMRGELAFAGRALIQQLDVAIESLEFPGAYNVLMQPYLLDTEFKELVTSGRISGSLTIGDGAPTNLDLQLGKLSAKDKSGKLGLQDLSGQLVWSANKDSERASHLLWSAANAYGLTGGATRLDFITSGADFQLLRPTFIPILDGGLSMQTLRVREFGAEQMSLRFEGELKPIGMPRLCKAFGWPEFSGTLAGRIPELNYEDGVLSVGGRLEANAFGGRLLVDGLELRNPLGNYPRLKADVILRGLDLEAVTGTFSFGMITGHLDGEIRELELFRWAPVRMDLRLYTPRGDSSRHLISQRAVKNLSSIGGGGGSVGAALQTGFLRFFENFRYRRLGLSCRLQNEICHMDGAGRAAGDSYYIVQGSGIPRIDIIGNARRVDWMRLVEQLKSMSASAGPVIR